ncbi:MAG: hypothetical protein GQ551_04450 [Myxococcales bacterium]|jgi:uncharacterized protein YhhL (DUF1145 family)|nr:hypothetical protein [Myxococcales bacterium]
MKFVIALGKVVALAAWAWGILSYLTPTSVPEAGIGQMVFLGLLAIHVAEAFAFAKGLAAEDGRTVGSHVGKLLVFGYFHVMSVRNG